MFDRNSVNLDILKKRAYYLRWATAPEGVIPLTAADPDFSSAPEIAEAIIKSIASINEEIRNQTITVIGYSKFYGLAGLRIGAVMAPNEKYFKKLYDASLYMSTIHGANVLSQIAVTTALNECDYWLKDFVIHLQKMKDLSVQMLNEINGFKCIAPEGCYVALANITGTGKSNERIKDILFDQAKVAVVTCLKE